MAVAGATAVAGLAACGGDGGPAERRGAAVASTTPASPGPSGAPASVTAPATTAAGTGSSTTAGAASSPGPVRPSTSTTPAPATTVAPTTTTLPLVPPRLLMAGDSTALMAGVGLARWGEGSGGADVVVTAEATQLGCGIGRGGERWDRANDPAAVPPRCAEWPERWPALVAREGADGLVVLVGPWDVMDRRLPGDPTWRAPGDPVYDAYLAGELAAAGDRFGELGIPVVWLTSPQMEAGRRDDPQVAAVNPVNDPARMRRLNQLVAEMAATRPWIQVVDLAGWLRALPGGEMDPALRPDGVHFTDRTSDVAALWLGPQVVQAWARAEAGLPPR